MRKKIKKKVLLKRSEEKREHGKRLKLAYFAVGTPGGRGSRLRRTSIVEERRVKQFK